MINISSSKRLIKRIILANICTEKKDLFLTPLICGKHGIGKSQIIKSIADDLHGYCITIEGGVLKEGEITGIPYQTKDDNGKIIFRFLPYYAVERIQNQEKLLFEKYGKNRNQGSVLMGDENTYSMNNISPKEKIDLLSSGKVEPVIIFIDEINRTENAVYKELMNILLTRTVNGYVFPWWVFFVGAMNPSTLGSMYATNEMDPAQLDRFVKLNVCENSNDWLSFARKTSIDPSIVEFIEEHPRCLSKASKFDDEEISEPSPRGWDMCDTILKSIPMLRIFFSKGENLENIEKADIRLIFTAKLGGETALMYFEGKKDKIKPIKPEEIFADDIYLSKVKKIYGELTPAKIIQTINLLVDYFKEHIDGFLKSNDYDKDKLKLREFVKLLDSSSKLLLAQNFVDIKTANGDSMILKMYDVFENELLDVLDLSEEARKLIVRY